MKVTVYVVDIRGVPTLIEETLRDGRQAEWAILRPATDFDKVMYPTHYYFKSGMVTAGAIIL